MSEKDLANMKKEDAAYKEELKREEDAKKKKK